MKKSVKLKRILPLFISAILLFVSCSDDDDNNNPPVVVPETITQIASVTSNLSSLYAALKITGLDATLNADGEFTVFAPTNDAFSTFLSANNFASLNEVPVDVLETVLLNHVIGSELPSTALSTGYVSTLSTQTDSDLNLSMFVDLSNGVVLNGVSTVVTADVEATNGVIHIVNEVIGLPTVVDHALANSDFSSLVAALLAADGDLVTALSGAGPFTVLAPGNDAFAEFLNGAELSDIPTDELASVLLNHVVSGTITSTNLLDLGAGYTTTLSTAAPDMNNLSLYFNTTDGVKFNGASSVVAADVVASNGIIHQVDAVIGLPDVVDFAQADPNFS